MISTRVSSRYWELIPWQGELSAQVRMDWDDLLSINATAPIYSCRAWFEIACRTKAITPWGILVVRSAGRPIGLFPLQKRTPWTWELISYFTQGDPQVVIDPQAAPEAWAGLAAWFRGMPALSLLSLGVSEYEPHLTHFTQACEEHCLTLRRQRSRMSLVLSHLPETWEAFLDGMDPSARKEVLHAEKRLLRDYPDTRVDYLSEPAACMSALEDFLRLYCLRWRCQAGGCRFDDQRHLDFYRAIVRWAVEQRSATLSLLRVRDRPVLVSTLFHLPGRPLLSEDLIARDIAALPKRYSPGIVESSHTMRWAIARGLRCVNQGPGSSRHKLIFAGEEYPLWEISVTQSAAAMRLLSPGDRGLHLCRRVPVHLSYRWEQLAARIGAFHRSNDERT